MLKSGMKYAKAILFLFPLIFFGVCKSAESQTLYWVGGSDEWDSLSWSDSLTGTKIDWTDGADAIFAQSNGGKTISLTDWMDKTFGSLHFQTGNYAVVEAPESAGTLTIGGTGKVTVDDEMTAYIAVVIKGNALTKDGGGSLTLSAANEFSGGVTISAGTLTLGNAKAAGTGTVTNDGSLNLNFDGVFENVLAGNGKITVGVPYTVTLTADSSGYTGELSVGDRSVLYVGNNDNIGAKISASSIKVDGGAFGGTGSVAGTVTFSKSEGGEIGRLIAGNFHKSLTFSDVVFKESSMAYFDLTGGAGAVNVMGELKMEEKSVLTAYVPSAGVFTLFKYGTIDHTSVNASAVGTDGFFVDSNKFNFDDNNEIIVTVLGLNQTMLLWEGNAGTWDDSAQDWIDTEGDPAAWGTDSGYVGVFTGIGGGAITVSGDQKFDTLQFKEDGYVISGDALEIVPGRNNAGVIFVDEGVSVKVESVISGNGKSLSKYGGGTLDLTANASGNTYDNGTLLRAGTVIVSDENQLGTGTITFNGGILAKQNDANTLSLSQNITLSTYGGTFEIPDGAFSLSGKVTGTGILTVKGNGDFFLENEENTYSGGTIVKNNATLVLKSAAAAGNGNIYLDGSGTGVDVDISADQTMDNSVFGEGTFTKIGDGALTMTGNLKAASVFLFAGSAGEENSLISTGEFQTENLDLFNRSSLTAKTLTFNTENQYSIQIGTDSSIKVETLQMFGTTGGNSITGVTDANFTYDRLEVKGINSFVNMPNPTGKEIHFWLDNKTILTGQAMLSGTNVDITDSKLTLSTAETLRFLNVGDKVTLIDSTTGILANDDDAYEYAAGAGVTTYLFTRDHTQPNKLVVEHQGKTTDVEAAKAYSEGLSAGFASVATAGKDVGMQGIDLSVAITPLGIDAAIMGGSTGGFSRHKTGSHVDVSSFSVFSGPVWRFDNDMGTSRVGAFIEAGWGSYDSRNTFSIGKVKGKGDVKHNGGGVLARHDFNVGFYTEASLRMGSLKTDFKTGDLGAKASYDTDMWYWGAHAGIGQLFTIHNDDSFEVYAKFFWTHQEGDKFTTDAGEYMDFSSADSTSTRIGARYRHALKYGHTVYVGAAWEHEFDGELKSSVDGQAIDPTSVKGNSGFFEAGINYTPGDSHWSFGPKIQGSFGKRQGISVDLSINYVF